MEPELGQGGGRQTQGTGIGQMAQARHQHQGQGHHQLAPALPPMALLDPLTAAGGLVVLAAGQGREPQGLQAPQQDR